MDYLELTNRAVEEAGVELDPLTAPTFASPPGAKMYSRFKKWVADSWVEIQTDSKETFFSNAVVVKPLRPRVRFFSGYASTAIAPKQYVDSAENVISISAEGFSLGGDWLATTKKGFLDLVPQADYSKLDSNTLYTEDTLAPNPNTFKISQFPAYAVAEIDPGLMSLTKHPITLLIDGTEFVIPYIEWKEWMHAMNKEYGTPLVYTFSPDGFLQFYPHLAQDAVLTAVGNTKAQVLVDHADYPLGLSDHIQPAIYWKAVMKYCNYEKDRTLWSTANREYMRYMIMLDRDSSTLPRFEDCRYG